MIGEALAAAVGTLGEATEWLLANGSADANNALAGASPYLRMSGIVIGGWLLTRSALAAAALRDGGDSGFSDEFLAQKLVTARFYATQLLPQAAGLAPAVTAGPRDLDRRPVLTDTSLGRSPHGMRPDGGCVVRAGVGTPA